MKCNIQSIKPIWSFLFCLLFVLFISTNEAFAHFFHSHTTKHDSIEQYRINNSDAIVQAEMLSDSTYVLENGKVYTSIALKIYKVFKGENIQDTIQLISKGGYVKDEEIGGFWIHEMDIGFVKHTNCIFFLEKRKGYNPLNIDKTNSFQLLTGRPINAVIGLKDVDEIRGYPIHIQLIIDSVYNAKYYTPLEKENEQKYIEKASFIKKRPTPKSTKTNNKIKECPTN